MYKDFHAYFMNSLNKRSRTTKLMCMQHIVILHSLHYKLPYYAQHRNNGYITAPAHQKLVTQSTFT